MPAVLEPREVVRGFDPGDSLSREEFLRRWEAMPGLRFAELLNGVVFMPSPVSARHGNYDGGIAVWLSHYEVATPGCFMSPNASWLMGAQSVPQPDNSLRVLPEYGGRSRIVRGLLAGAPELAAEVGVSSASYDLHQKLAVYETHGVQEYLAVLVREAEVRWHRLVNGALQVVAEPPDGVYRSTAFPGLWLDAAALLALDTQQLVAVLQQGLATPEHAAFVAQLAQAKQPPQTDPP